jgi:hypothetical protein
MGLEAALKGQRKRQTFRFTHKTKGRKNTPRKTKSKSGRNSYKNAILNAKKLNKRKKRPAEAAAARRRGVRRQA